MYLSGNQIETRRTGKGERMRTKSSASTRRKKGRVASKMPKIEFNKEAIKEIKKRKKGVYHRFLKQSEKGR